ncbi:MAG: fluoride efflux transporter CrcB [Candidatus Nanopelagicales bacterium]
MTVVMVIIGGATGALARYYSERFSVRRFGERVPYGTAFVNLLGAFILGLVFALARRGAISHDLLLLLGTGFCGALTTFSGFMGQIENRLRHKANRPLAITYGASVMVLGIALAALGLRLGS